MHATFLTLWLQVVQPLANVHETKWTPHVKRETDVAQSYRPLSRRLDRCDRVIQNESRDPFGGNAYYVTMQITLPTRKFRNGEHNLHCDVVHITTKWVSSLTLDCNGVFAIKAYTSSATAIGLHPIHAVKVCPPSLVS